MSAARPRTAMILAAGFGTRMRPLTDRLPKPLVPLAGRTLLDRALDLAEAAGATRAVVNLHYRGAQIRAHLADRTGPEIVFSEEDPILETGGGVQAALPHLGPAPFYTLNPDGLWQGPNPLEGLASAWDGTAAALLLFVARHRALAHAGPGDFHLDRPGGPPRRRDGPVAPYVYTGAQIIAPGAFEGEAEGAFSLNRVWDRLAAEGRLAAIVYPGDWVDIGTPAGLAAAERGLRSAAP
ncbi:MAG: nucleotidyltransferase family protein [Paracoccaceae bacterium]